MLFDTVCLAYKVSHCYIVLSFELRKDFYSCSVYLYNLKDLILGIQNVQLNTININIYRNKN